MQWLFEDEKQDDEKDGKEESPAAAPVGGEGKREEGMHACTNSEQFIIQRQVIFYMSRTANYLHASKH